MIATEPHPVLLGSPYRGYVYAYPHKTAYRRLMNQHHPDKLVARGLPKSMIGVAEQKTHEVRTAYERIKTQRGFK